MIIRKSLRVLVFKYLESFVSLYYLGIFGILGDIFNLSFLRFFVFFFLLVLFKFLKLVNKHERKKFHISSLKYLGYISLIRIVYEGFHLGWFFFFFFFALITTKEDKKHLKGRSVLPYYLTSTLASLNPFVFVQSILQIAGQAYIFIANLKGLPNPVNYQNKSNYILPFKGKWMTINGGSLKENSHSWDILTQRYAYDFVIVDDKNSSSKNDGRKLDDYYCYSKEVLSPANGEVVKIKNGVRDYQGVGDLTVDWKTTDFRGNHIIIKHNNSEYSFIAHILKNSFTVRVGDKVKSGQVVGICGNSGNSTEPHIHYHLQNNRCIWIGTGLPIKFNRFKRNNIQVQSGYIEKNEIVKNY